MMPEQDYSAEEIEFDAIDGEEATLSASSEVESTEVTLAVEASRSSSTDIAERVSADIAAQIPGWRGVRSCSDADRARAAALPYAQKWANETYAANPGREVIGSAFYGRHNWDNWTTSSGRRKCKGWWSSCIVYVDFAD